jgi:hypothetical protein
MAGLSLAGIIKIFALPDAYAAREFSWHAAKICWEQGVAGWPFAGWLLILAGGILTFHVARADGGWGRTHGLAVACVLVGGLLWIYWSAEPHRWAKALDYRRFVVPMSAPFFFLAWLEFRERRCGQPTPNQNAPRETVALILGAIFVAVLGLQSAEWRQLQRRVLHELQESSSVVVSTTNLPWIRNTPLDHWSTTALVIAHGVSDKLLVDAPGLQVWNSKPRRVPLSFFQSYPVDPGPGGWFDFRAAALRGSAEKTAEEESH